MSNSEAVVVTGIVTIHVRLYMPPTSEVD